MRIPLLFTELLEMLEEDDVLYDSIESCKNTTKEMAKEINLIKSKFQVTKNIETNVKFKKNVFRKSIASIPSEKKHHFKISTVKKEYCIVCFMEIEKFGMKCNICEFYVHMKCTKHSTQNCSPIEKDDVKEINLELSEKSSTYNSKIENIKCLSDNKFSAQVDVYFFSDGVLIVQKGTETLAVDFVKYYSSVTKQSALLEKTSLNGKSSKNSFTLYSPRWFSLRYEFSFSSPESAEEYFQTFSNEINAHSFNISNRVDQQTVSIKRNSSSTFYAKPRRFSIIQKENPLHSEIDRTFSNVSSDQLYVLVSRTNMLKRNDSFVLVQ